MISQEQVELVMEAYWNIFGAVERGTVLEWVNLELSTAQLKVLFILNFMGPLPIGQIANLTKIGLPTASHLVEKLVEVGYAERTTNAEDRRYIHAAITPKGREVTIRLRQGRRERLLEWLIQMDETSFAALNVGLQALLEIALTAQPKPASYDKEVRANEKEQRDHEQ